MSEGRIVVATARRIYGLLVYNPPDGRFELFLITMSQGKRNIDDVRTRVNTRPIFFSSTLSRASKFLSGASPSRRVSRAA
jgi:hypothetical protein